jgi:dTDP-4-amino-4,6-dideoxygalactose transaminase
VKYVNDVQGYNSRLDEVQAAVLGVKLQHLDAWNARRARQAERYLHALANTSLVLPHVLSWADPVWHLFVVRSTERDRLQQFLQERGIATIIHYPIPPHHQEAYASLGIARDAFPIAERMAREVLSLPIGPHMSDAQQQQVIEALLEFDAART